LDFIESKKKWIFSFGLIESKKMDFKFWTLLKAQKWIFSFGPY